MPGPDLLRAVLSRSVRLRDVRYCASAHDGIRLRDAGTERARVLHVRRAPDAAAAGPRTQQACRTPPCRARALRLAARDLARI